jgi:vanillate O-demethylase monooxygenase subunit
MPVAANYLRMHENVLDLSHFEYLHPGSVGTDDFTRLPVHVDVRGEEVHMRRELIQAPAAPNTARLGIPPGALVDRLSEGAFVTPGVHILLRRVTPRDGAPLTEMLMHAFTPETERSCHYFYSVGRDHHLGDAELSAMSVKVIRDTFLQDKEALELIEERFELDGTQPEVSVASDKAGLQMRRAVTRLMSREESKLRKLDTHD